MVLSKFKEIQVVILDVDGVLTNASVQVNEVGEQFRTFNVYDGYAIQLARKSGIHIWAITGGKSQGIKHRLQSLGVNEVFLDTMDKLPVLEKLAEKYQIPFGKMLYMGDDMPDYLPMQKVGLPVCPLNAVPEIKAISQYVSPVKGGSGAVRDVLEKILKLQGKWSIEVGVKSV